MLYLQYGILYANIFIAISVECEVQGAEGAGVVELGEIDLVGEVGGAPVALLDGVIKAAVEP